MTWTCTTDAWTCPDCGWTVGRRRLNDRQWAKAVRDVQTKHGVVCKGGRP